MWAIIVGLVAQTAIILSTKMTYELRNLGLLGVASLLLCMTGLAAIEGIYYSLQWGIVATLIWGYAWQQCWQRRDTNRPTEFAPLYTSLGLANRLTLLRGLLIAMTAGFIFQHPQFAFTIWIPALLYSVAAILDRVDGFVARRTKHSSLLGSTLDNIFDALGLIVAPILAVDLGKIHWSYLLVSVAYYAFQLGLAWRRKNKRTIAALAPNKLRRTLAGFQMGYVAVALWPPFSSSITQASGFAFMLPVLLGFIVDWFIVTGRLQPRQTANYFDALKSFSYRYLLPSLRIVYLCFLAALVFNVEMSEVSLLSLSLGSILILLGCGARIGAVIILLVLALQTPSLMITPALLALLWLSSWIALLGSGRFSAWRGDDDWVERQDGAS